MVAKRGMTIGGGAGRGEADVGIAKVSGDEMVAISLGTGVNCARQMEERVERFVPQTNQAQYKPTKERKRPWIME